MNNKPNNTHMPQCEQAQGSFEISTAVLGDRLSMVAGEVTVHGTCGKNGR